MLPVVLGALTGLAYLIVTGPPAAAPQTRRSAQETINAAAEHLADVAAQSFVPPRPLPAEPLPGPGGAMAPAPSVQLPALAPSVPNLQVSATPASQTGGGPLDKTSATQALRQTETDFDKNFLLTIGGTHPGPVDIVDIPTTTPKPKPYILNAGKTGLPIAEGPRPSWLVKEDELVIDARSPQFGGMLIIQPVLMDADGGWGKPKASRPRWLRSILATNRFHARQHGHAVVLRWHPTHPQLTKWQRRQCGSKVDERTCTKNNERENFNWEKHLMLSEYLTSPQNFTHVLMLDADAALVKHPLNILGEIAKQMEARNLDVFLTSEDWLKYGENRINGGFLMTRNSAWTRHLFQDTFRAHVKGPGGLRSWKIGLEHQECSSNEQICLNDIMSGSGKEVVKGHMTLESGIIYNRGGCTVRSCGSEPISDRTMETLGMNDDRLQVLHFMGGSKRLAPEVLCDGGKDYTGDGPKGYGCMK